MISSGENWESALERSLPLFGHRNWIVIADSAYPAQTASGIEVTVADKDQAAVLASVLRRIDQSQHIQPVAHLDFELKLVPEEDAPGVSAYRSRLAELLDSRSVVRAPHDEIIQRLSTAGELYRILVIKTRMTIPYTSVFLELGCGYWSIEAEQRLRERLAREA